MKRFGDFTLDLANECLWHRGARITLQPKPFALLRYLVENPKRLLTHGELLRKLWPKTFVQPQALRTYVLELRRTLGDSAAQPCYIQTLPKRGYCFMAQVSECSQPQRGELAAEQRSPGLDERKRELRRQRERAEIAAEERHWLSPRRRSTLHRTRGGLFLRVPRACAGKYRSILLRLTVRRKV